MPLPGDDLVPDPGYEHTRDVRAPAEEVWPWLAQIGQGRGGFYSYEWLENLAGCDIHNADEIRPEWQRRSGTRCRWLVPRSGASGARRPC
jgi:hypothetical protein